MSDKEVYRLYVIININKLISVLPELKNIVLKMKFCIFAKILA